ncbi:hypothetical protein [Enterococcus phage vB_Efs8_KEN04]|uniref:Uncharacterized protein n=1 Tax=Enterococcus phage vB_Efs6_KEN16 TaxID=3138325 RepID=A0AAX4PTS8_9CAUD
MLTQLQSTYGDYLFTKMSYFIFSLSLYYYL